MPRPIHFDLTADDPKRAMRFYETVFGWKFQKWDGPMEYYMATTGSDKEPGINGGISKKGESGMPNMNTIGVPDVEQFSKKIQSNGGKILQPKTPIPGVGWFATCQDTEGNIFGIIQDDKNAK
ncbi:VOC family protein [Nitrososphaera sp.]|uniref:VOC family protein n=1 Tax=Nitrososphaera sp. TaxID=1971748 RepID=UPI0017F28E36|nr:VOC family protein [Nitrososphaera sp.]NWG36331.1 VOC family protein [Nitrososphaera sp.]